MATIEGKNRVLRNVGVSRSGGWMDGWNGSVPAKMDGMDGAEQTELVIDRNCGTDGDARLRREGWRNFVYVPT